jgi:hypothetical protein
VRKKKAKQTPSVKRYIPRVGKRGETLGICGKKPSFLPKPFSKIPFFVFEKEIETRQGSVAAGNILLKLDFFGIA